MRSNLMGFGVPLRVTAWLLGVQWGSSLSREAWDGVLRNSRSPGRGCRTQAKEPTAPGTLAHSHLPDPHPQSPHHSHKTPFKCHLFKRRFLSPLPPFLAGGSHGQFKKRVCLSKSHADWRVMSTSFP